MQFVLSPIRKPTLSFLSLPVPPLPPLPLSHFLFLSRLVGTLGFGPKYLVDEYSILDTRYWVTFDPCVTIVSSLEAVVMIPFCFLWYVDTPH